MRTNDEMSVYLEELVEHERSCDVENCALCQSAQNIYRLARNLVFSEVVYPEVAMAARGRAMKGGDGAENAGTFFTPRAA